jgi:cysteine synthase
MEPLDHSTLHPVYPPRADILDAIGNTPLVEVMGVSPNSRVSIYAKLEGANPTGSLKDRIAKYMIEQAEKEGKLEAGKIILEPTSGNTGISLAMIGGIKGYTVHVVIPENVSVERIHLLRAYGAEIHYSEGSLGTNGAIQVAQKMMEKEKRYVMLYQYGNPANPRAHYETTGKEIVQALPDVDVFVAGLGTGGTLMGVGRRLKEHNNEAKIIAVAPPQDDLIQGLRRLEDGFTPPIIDLDLLDARIMIESREAFRWTKELLHRSGIFAGISSGAVIACARRIAQRMEKGKIVCLLADGGWKYLSTGLWSREYGEMEEEINGKVWW